MQREPLHATHAQRLAHCGIADLDPGGARLVRFAPGETLLREGMPIEELLIIVSGRAKVSAAAANGRDLLLCYYVSEGILGDIELLTGAREAVTTVRAITEFTCIALPYAAYAETLLSQLPFVRHIARGLAEKLLYSSRANANNALHAGKERLAAYILRSEAGSAFSEPLTDAARATGMSYRHLVRLLGAMREEGLLQKTGRGYRITDADALRRLAQDFAGNRLARTVPSQDGAARTHAGSGGTNTVQIKFR